MRPCRFPKVNDVMLAEALRQLLPVASYGMASTSVTNHRRSVRYGTNSAIIALGLAMPARLTRAQP
jgi:hypothetical protein